MNDVVILDTGPLGLLCNPSTKPTPTAARQWLMDLLAAGRRVVLPELADYELRRELMRANLVRAVARLDALARHLEYRPLDTSTMRMAAELWASARNAGFQTAPDPALDGDVILCAQALTHGVPVVVATGNPIHISRFVPAAQWTAITP
jgi:predicted nucleic acid-binding protein